jgi:hypothetical protein
MVVAILFAISASEPRYGRVEEIKTMQRTVSRGSPVSWQFKNCTTGHLSKRACQIELDADHEACPLITITDLDFGSCEIKNKRPEYEQIDLIVSPTNTTKRLNPAIYHPLSTKIPVNMGLLVPPSPTDGNTPTVPSTMVPTDIPTDAPTTGVSCGGSCLYVYYCHYFASSEYGSGGGLANNHRPDRPGVRVGDKSNVRSLTDASPDAPSNTTNEVPTNTATDVPTTGISWDGSYFYCYYFTSMTNEAPTDTPTYTPTTGISYDGSSEYGGGGLANNQKPSASDSNRSNIKFRSPTDAPPGDAPTDTANEVPTNTATDVPTTGISWDGSYFYCHYFASSEYGGGGLAKNHRPGASDDDESNSSPARQQTHHLMHPVTRPTRCPPTRPSATVTASTAVPCVRPSAAVTVLSKTGLLFPFGSLAPMPLSSLASLGATQQQSTHQQRGRFDFDFDYSSHSSSLDTEAPLEIQPEARNADLRLLKKQLREAQKQVEAMAELVNTMKAQALQPHLHTVDDTLIKDVSSLAAEHVDKIGGLLNVALGFNNACD